MEKAILTVVVSGNRVRDVVECLRDNLDENCSVYAGGDISISEKDLLSLPNEVWLGESDGPTRFALVPDTSSMSPGRLLTEEELAALTEFGVCVELKASCSRAVDFGIPQPEAIFTAMAQATELGFKVTSEAGFETNYQGSGTDSIVVRRWLRVRVPAWMNFAATL